MKIGNPIDEFQVTEDFVTTAKPKTKTSTPVCVLSESEYKKRLPLSSFLLFFLDKPRVYAAIGSAIYMKTPNSAILAACRPCRFTSNR
jgi:hypothetical protein